MIDLDKQKLDQIVLNARNAREQSDQGYREKALKLYPHICGRCCREFSRTNLHELTVHHRDHDHDNNPSDGSNWELLCLYCHDNEHQRHLEAVQGRKEHSINKLSNSSFNPFGELKEKLGKKK